MELEILCILDDIMNSQTCLEYDVLYKCVVKYIFSCVNMNQQQSIHFINIVFNLFVHMYILYYALCMYKENSLKCHLYFKHGGAKRRDIFVDHFIQARQRRTYTTLLLYSHPMVALFSEVPVLLCHGSKHGGLAVRWEFIKRKK